MGKYVLDKYSKIVDDLLEKCLREDSIVVDATVGNGNDSLKILKIIGKNGKLYGFDIQEQAIDNTRKLLTENNFSNFELIRKSHEYIGECEIEKIDLAIFNLGYLPKGDKEIVTKGESTVKAISATTEILNENGIIIIVQYVEHEHAIEEKEEVEKFLAQLNQKSFTVNKIEFFNQINYPPIVYLIERIK